MLFILNIIKRRLHVCLHQQVVTHAQWAGGWWVVGGAYNSTTCTPRFSYLTREKTGPPLGGINVVVKLKYKDEFN